MAHLARVNGARAPCRALPKRARLQRVGYVRRDDNRITRTLQLTRPSVAALGDLAAEFQSLCRRRVRPCPIRATDFIDENRPVVVRLDRFPRDGLELSHDDHGCVLLLRFSQTFFLTCYGGSSGGQTVLPTTHPGNPACIRTVLAHQPRKRCHRSDLQCNRTRRDRPAPRRLGARTLDPRRPACNRY
jgi:hypothetical protein